MRQVLIADENLLDKFSKHCKFLCENTTITKYTYIMSYDSFYDADGNVIIYFDDFGKVFDPLIELICELTEYIESTNENPCAIFIDFKKATIFIG